MNKILDELSHQYKILSAIANSFLSVHEIDLVNNEVHQFHASERLSKFIDVSGDAKKSMKDVLNNLVINEDFEKVLEFNDLSTLSERLKGKDYIEEEFIGKDVGWFKEKFISVDVDDNGYPTTVILLSEIIEKQKKKEQELFEMSYIDELTKLYNRRAYEKDINDPSTMDDDFIYVSLDLNGLKGINDNLGHNYGDDAIRGAGRCIESTFSKCGSVYRTGGDEYIALLHCSVETIYERISHLKKLLKKWSDLTEFDSSVSIGFAARTEFPLATNEELAQVADQRMYEDKENYYLEHPECERRGK